MASHGALTRALAGECRNVSGAVLAIPEKAFALRTRCPEWDARGLLGHLYRGIDRIEVALGAAPPADVTHDAVSYFRSYDRTPGSADARDVARRGNDVADGFQTGLALAEAWDRRWPVVVELAEIADPARPVATFGPALRLDEYLRTRILEVTVHGLDLADALGVVPWATEEGLSITAGILKGLAGTTGSDRVDWGSVPIVEAATGRRVLPDPAGEALGDLAARFPVLS